MRLSHISDIHFDSHRKLSGAIRSYDGRPWGVAHTEKCVREIMSKSGKIDLWLLTGDIFDRPTPTGLEERAAIDVCTDMAITGPVIVLAGNHDVPMTAAGSTALECLRRRQGVYVIEEPQLVAFANGKRVGTGPFARDSHPDIVIACVPYPRRGELAAAAGGKIRNADERNAFVSDALTKLVHNLRAQAVSLCGGVDTIPLVLAYHGSIGGAKIRHQPRALANDVVLAVTDLHGWSYVACGHIHQQQEMAAGVWYAGSPDRCDFGEEGEPKGGITIDLPTGTIQTIASTATEFVTLAPDDMLTTLDRTTAYRVKGTVTELEAVRLRERIAMLQAEGFWIGDALTVEREVRLRDDGASALEDPGTMLRRWLDGRAEVANIALTFAKTHADVLDSVCDLHDDIA